MNLAEVTRTLRQLRVSGMAGTLEARIVQAQAERWAPLGLVSALIQDEDAHHVELSGRGLGQAPRRCRRRERDARPVPPPRKRAQVRTAELADQSQRVAERASRGLEANWSWVLAVGRFRPVRAWEFSPVHRG